MQVTHKDRMMRNHMIVNVVFLLFFSYISSVFAATLDVNTIKSIHEETKKAYNAKCIKDFKNSTSAICACLADLAQFSLDDAALTKCQADQTGTNCISKVVAEAATKASTQENVDSCAKKMPTSTTQEPKANPASEVMSVPASALQ